MIDLLKNISGTISTLTIIASALSASAFFLFKMWRNGQRVYNQLIPNGGSSLADQINYIKKSIIISNQRQSMLWATINVPYYECDEHGVCTYVNEALANLFGMSRDEMLTLGWVKAIVGQHERVRVVDEFMAAVRNKLPYDVEYRVKNQRTGEEFMAKATAQHCLDEKKKSFICLDSSPELVLN